MFRYSYTTYDVETNMMRCRITDSDDGDVEILVDRIDDASNSVIISMQLSNTIPAEAMLENNWPSLLDYL